MDQRSGDYKAGPLPGVATDSATNKGRDLRISLILAIVGLVVYNANLRSISAADTFGARYLPFAMWRYHTILLDPVATIAAQGRPIPTKPDQGYAAFWIVRVRGGHKVSLYPITAPLLVAPLYLPAVAYLDVKGWDPMDLDRVARIMEKLSASLLAAMSTALLYLLLRRRADPRLSFLLALAYALGTTTWMIGSQALWQHGMAELLIVAAMFVLTGSCNVRRAILAGILCGLIACNRPPDSLIAAALAIYGLWWARRLAPLMVAASTIPAVFLLVYNFGVIGHYAGAYGLIGKASFFQHNALYGLAVLLFSPSKGLFVFSPFLLVIPICLPQVFADRRTRAITTAVGIAGVALLLVYSKADWRQGASWGPRWLTDLLPILFWMLPPAVKSLNRIGRVAFVLACCVAIAIEVIGAFWYTGVSDIAIYAASAQPSGVAAIWNFRNAPFVAELRHPRAPAELTDSLQGNFDTMSTHDGVFQSIATGGPITVEGWALFDGHTPYELRVLVDGKTAAVTRDFLARPDVTKALGYASPSGWRITIPRPSFNPGQHTIAIVTSAKAGGDMRYLVQRPFKALERARGNDLALSAGIAAAILANRQRPEGYWLTAFNNGVHFRQLGQELNIFAIAAIVDLLKPVEADAGLAESVRLARRFLSEQIESNGLVRYHGRPDAATIGTLGCAITPDSDDTTLVWRIAPSTHSQLLPMALATLQMFRTPQGLYRTWLAAQDHYQCIDPGHDPDPVDATIQMHVLMLLSQTNPPAARALCQALQRSIQDERIWVYYRKAPLLPILREADLRQAGCPVEVPVERIRTAPPEQHTWIAAADQLERMLGAGGPPPTDVETHNLLGMLANDDFSALRNTPPLLYHNDLTASVTRYYWSEDFGFALWLRLYFENMRRSSDRACAGQHGPATCHTN
jgi:hypothetical protein